ncbi:MAG: DUF3817 domain-containing protein [Flavobacteriaceae bacterium]|nr:DUF3817 domain-containing protein [Flavobacteriaceae bacterium]
MTKSTLSLLRIVSFLEGLSFLVILFITMPLKYYYNTPEPARPVGMAHGVLFILYVVLVLISHFKIKWTFKTTFLALLASIIPFGTFVADAKIFKKYSN